MPHQRIAVHTGHHDIGNDDIGTRAMHRIEPLAAVVGHRHLEAAVTERVGQNLGQHVLVLNQQDRYLFNVSHRRAI